MGTFHSFISAPLSKDEADTFYKQVRNILSDSRYSNDPDNCFTQCINGLYVVYGIVKNLGGPPVELMKFEVDVNWCAVSDEKDFCNHE